MFPTLPVRRRFYLPVGQGHQLHVEESGNPQGQPVVVLHGGPGGGVSASLRRFFDPQHWRVILFDQRGAGQSLPHASVEANRTDLLVADMEQLRAHLGIERWLLFGGSWGATLALAYAQVHPQRVSAMVLRGVFLCRQRDLDWLYDEAGAARLFPEQWQTLLAQAPPGDGNLLQRYYAGLQGPDARRYARHWCNWEAHLALQPVLPDGDGDDDELAMARLETHYFIHQGFLPAPLLEQASRLTMPVDIVQGCRDYVCPGEQAWALHQQLPNSRLHWVDNGGHSSADPAIANALVEAVEAAVSR